MKPSKKVAAALKRRQEEYTPIHSVSGFAMVKPGSQNPKKGKGLKRGRRSKH